MNSLKNAVGIPAREWADGPWSPRVAREGREDVNRQQNTRLAHPRSAFVSCGMRSWWLLGGILLLGSFSRVRTRTARRIALSDLNASGPLSIPMKMNGSLTEKSRPRKREPSDPFPKQTL